MTNYVSISGTPTSSISNHTKHIDLPRWTKYRLLNEGKNNILSHLSIRDNSVVSSLTGSNSKVTGRRKVGRNKSLIDKIKILLNDCGGLS